MLLDCGQQDIIDGLRHLAEDGRIEFLESAMYHPILPVEEPCRSTAEDRYVIAEDVSRRVREALLRS